MSIDLDALRARNEARRHGRSHAKALCAADVDELLRALEVARIELRKLREEHADLMSSAELWADLYTASARRANAAEERLRQLADAPVDVQRYYAALDTIAVLTEALESVVRDCAACALDVTSSLRDIARDRFCGRCMRAVDALLTTINAR
jgi:hypothetical protein